MEKQIKFMIDSWFYENRPDMMNYNDEFIDNIYNHIKEEIQGLRPNEATIIVSEYLRLNYSHIGFIIAQEVMEEDEFESYRALLNADDMPPFMAHGDLESITDQINEMRLIDKYGGSDDELLRNEALRADIRNIVREVADGWNQK